MRPHRRFWRDSGKQKGRRRMGPNHWIEVLDLPAILSGAKRLGREKIFAEGLLKTYVDRTLALLAMRCARVSGVVLGM